MIVYKMVTMWMLAMVMNNDNYIDNNKSSHAIVITTVTTGTTTTTTMIAVTTIAAVNTNATTTTNALAFLLLVDNSIWSEEIHGNTRKPLVLYKTASALTSILHNSKKNNWAEDFLRSKAMHTA